MAPENTEDERPVTLEDVAEILDDRPLKFDAEQVGYKKAPEGDPMRCASCHHFFRRATDGFTVCEIFRDEQTDAEGVAYDWVCRFWTPDGSSRPLV